MEIGKRIYYDKANGNVIQIIDERSGTVMPTTVEEDFANYATLAAWIPERVGHIDLDFGQNAEDFRLCNGYSIDLESGTVQFAYPDPEEPGTPPVYQPPLSEAVATLERRQDLMQTAIDDLILGGGF